MSRCFTYVKDIVDGVYRVILNPAKKDSNWDPEVTKPDSSSAPYVIYNIGNDENVNLMDFIHALEDKLGVEIEKEMLPLQDGDVKDTYADISALKNDLYYTPKTSYKEGISKFVDWYKTFYNK